MKVLKKVVKGVVVAVIGLLLGSLLLPSKWSVERSIVVNAPAARIYPLVANFKKGWLQWSSFDREDPSITYTYSGPDTGAGASRAWVSRRMGNGGMTIVKADPQQGVEFSLEMNGEKGAVHGTIAFAPEGKATRVTWTDAGEIGVRHPIHRYVFTFAIDRIMGPHFERSLAALKEKAEGKK